MKANIKSIAVGKAKSYMFGKNEFQSAYKKDEFVEFIRVDKYGFIGDEQFDHRYHGGVDKAIHIGSNKHLKRNPNFDRLSIGCNILVKKIDESDVCVGDVYKIGEVKVEVTQPRQPCWKIGALFGKQTSRYISKKHATGWYVRVLKDGTIKKKDQMILKKRVSNLTIKNLSQYLKFPPTDKRIIDEVLNLEAIGSSYRKDFLKALQMNNS